MSLPVVLNFQDCELDVVDRAGVPWLLSPQIGDAVGYEQPRQAIDKLYKRYVDEFTDEMTAVIKLEHGGQRRDVRAFSPRGCHLIAMLARTERAKAFRAWVLDVLEGLAPPPGPSKGPGHARMGEADNVVAAGRCFSAYMRVGKAFGVAQGRLAREANAAALQRTGINMMADLGITDADLPPDPAAYALQDPLQDPLKQWLAARDGKAFTADEAINALWPDTNNRTVLRSRLGLLLARLGVPRKRERVDGRQLTVYYPALVH